jgi:flagellar motor switch protein FliM
MSTAKALRRALARTADELWTLPLVCTALDIETLDQDGVVDMLTDDSLLVVLDGPDGAAGLAQVDRAVLTGITEIQTIQMVTDLPVDPRPLTHTDAAMIAPLINDSMVRFALNLDSDPIRPQIEGFRFGAMIEDKRGAALLLDAPEYRAFQARLDLDGGTRSGVMSILLPVRPLAAADLAGDTDGDAPHAEALMDVNARLNCVLARVRLPLSRAEELRPGDLLPLAAQALDGVELVTSGGVAVAGGRLGQLNGARAVRLAWPKGAGAAAGAAALAPAAALSDPAHGISSLGDMAEPGVLDGDFDIPEAEPDFAAPMGELEIDMGLPDDTEPGALPDLPPLEPMGEDDPLAAFGGADLGGDGEEMPDFSGAAMDFDIES